MIYVCNYSRDFFPRGKGIKTRRPLVLQLIHVDYSEGSEDVDEWAEFPNNDFEEAQAIKFTNFDDVRTEIERLTDLVAGHNKGVSEIPINLKIFSPNGNYRY